MVHAAFLDTSSERMQRWLFAALVMLTLHATGGTLGLMQWPDDETEEEPSGAVFMELAPLAVAPPERQDLAIGPPAEAAVPTPVPTKEAVLEELDLPTVEESPLAPMPELVLPKVQPVETLKEVEEDSELQQKEQEVTEVNTASSVPMALRALDAPPDKTVKAQSVGERLKPSAAEVKWQRALLFHLNRHKRYPVEARSRHVQGVAQVEFRIDNGGHLTEARIVKGSGSELLDEEAMEILKRASPFPAPPDPSTSGNFRLALPIEFRIR